MMVPDNLLYTAKDFFRTLPAKDYIEGYRDPERFIEYCRQCKNYGRSWGCPPFDHDLKDIVGEYVDVLLTATKIVPVRDNLLLNQSRELVRPERLRLEKWLRELEQNHGGKAFAYVGSCLYCKEGTCTRPDGFPCRHPDLVRPSLEAYGFDIGKTLNEIFGLELKWGVNGKMPEYLILVCGFFHNSSSLTASLQPFLIANH